MSALSSLLLLSLVQTQVAPPQSQLHNAIDPGPEVLQKMWDKGFKDANKKKGDDWIYNKLTRGIGKVRTNVFGATKTVSYFLLVPPEAVAYSQGFDARRKYWSDEEVARSKTFIASNELSHPGSLVVRGLLSIQPSFGGYGSFMDRAANARDIEDVRVVLQVGDHIYQPLVQPGNIPFKEGVGAYTRSVPRSETSYTDFSGTYGRSSDPTRNHFSGDATTTSYYTEIVSGNYRYYEANFDATFSLFDPDGKPRIPADVKEINFIVIYGRNEHKATYRMSDLLGLRN